MKPGNLRRCTIHIRHLTDVNLSREIYIKLCQNYTNTYIYQILYKSCSIKQTIFNKYETNLKTTISQKSLRILDLPLSSFFSFFAILIDIIDDIFTYCLYSPYYVTRTSTNGGAVSLSHVSAPSISRDLSYTPFNFPLKSL